MAQPQPQSLGSAAAEWAQIFGNSPKRNTVGVGFPTPKPMTFLLPKQRHPSDGFASLYPLPTTNSNTSLTMCVSKFDKLLTRNVPHILEKIFLSLDYNTFKKCQEVS